LDRDTAICALAIRWSVGQCRRRTVRHLSLAVRGKSGQRSGRHGRPTRRVRRPVATVRRRATDTGRLRGASITLDIRRLGAGTRPGRHSGRRQATVVSGRPATVTRIGLGQALDTGQVTDHGQTLVTVRPTTTINLAMGLARGPRPEGRFRPSGSGETITASHPATALVTGPTDTAGAAIQTRPDMDPTVIVTAGTALDRHPASTVRRPVTAATVAGIRRQRRTGTARRLADTTTDPRPSTEGTATRAGQATIRAVTKVNTRRGRVMVEGGRAGLALARGPDQGLDRTDGCRRAGRIGGGLAIRGRPGRVTRRWRQVATHQVVTHRAGAIRRTTGSRQVVRHRAGRIHAGRRTATARLAMRVKRARPIRR
jgi:hypothetical protein